MIYSAFWVVAMARLGKDDFASAAGVMILVAFAFSQLPE
jgi:hypothetical protein